MKCKHQLFKFESELYKNRIVCGLCKEVRRIYAFGVQTISKKQLKKEEESMNRLIKAGAFDFKTVERSK